MKSAAPLVGGRRRCAGLGSLSELVYWLVTVTTAGLRTRLRVARLKLRLELCSCRFIALSKRLASVAARFNSCGALPARRSGFNSLARRVARFDARRPSGRLTGLPCRST